MILEIAFNSGPLARPQRTGSRTREGPASRLVSRFRGSAPDTASSCQETTDPSLPSVELMTDVPGASAADFELGPAAEGPSRFDETAASFSVATGALGPVKAAIARYSGHAA